MKIELKEIKKQYGDKTVLNNINLTFEKGILGILGENGAGKTTLLNIISSFIEPTEGQIYIDGIALEKNKNQIYGRIGYLPQNFTPYSFFTIYEFMDYMAILTKIKKKKQKIEQLLEQVNLQQEKKKKIRELSGGMVRRLGIAQALINDPEVLIVDEPTSGLDPEERIRFRNLLTLLAEKKTVLLSTHIVSDIEYICENLIVLNKGELLYNGTSEELKQKAKGKIWVYKENANSILKKMGQEIDIKNVLSAKRENENLVIKLYGKTEPINKATLGSVDLEEAYMALIKEHGNEN